MTVAEPDDTIKRAAVKPAKHVKTTKRSGRKSGNQQRKQEHRPERAETDSSTDKVAREPDVEIVPPTATITPIEQAAEPEEEAEPTTGTAGEAPGNAPAEHIDTSTAASEEVASQTTDTPVNASNHLKIPATNETEQAAPAINEELDETDEIPSAEIKQLPAPGEQEQQGTSVDIATLPPPETPRPVPDASSTLPEAGNISTVETSPPDTPYPDVIDEIEAATGAAAPTDLIESETPVEAEAPVDADNPVDVPSPSETEAAEPAQAPPQIPAKQPALAPLEKWPLTRAGRPRTLIALALLAVFVASSLLFWQDISAAHLYIATLNPSDGAILTRADSGRGYSGDTVIAPALERSTVFSGVVGNQPASPAQQVVELQQHGAAWQQTNRFNAPLTHGTLSVTQQGNLVIESERGLEVTTPGGQLLWRVTGDSPARGAHAFQPAFDSNTLYTVKSAAAGQIAAYDLQDGALRWTASLNDTLNYAPPLLLVGPTLYIAGDHVIFALNSSNGSLLWTAPHAARTLLLSGSGAHQLLIAASADGLLALNTSNGSLRWAFYGQAGKMTPAGVLSLTPAQFYQASATDTTIFATGIAWQAPQILPELWLYALDASTGDARWSRQLASGTLSADAGRVFTPLVDSARHLVLLEQQMDSDTLALVAYDNGNGQTRWQTQFQGATSPSSLALSDNALLFITIQADSGTALSAMTLPRLLLLTMMLLSIFGLLLLLLFPLHSQQRRCLIIQKQATSIWKAAYVRRFAQRLPAIALLVILIAVGTGVVGYAQLHQARESVSLVDMHTGATRWQQGIPTSDEALAASGQGSILSVVEQANMRRVQGIDTSGAVRWQTFASAGTFSIPAAPTRPGTLLLALSGHIPLHNTFAPADPAYAPPLNSLFILSLLNRDTGQPLWQSAIVNPGDQQSATVIGADTRFIYVASQQTNEPGDSDGAAMQLLAVDQTSGQVSWRVSGPLEPLNTPRNNGTLLLQGRQIFWQVEGSVYAIDSLMGQIAWRRSFGNDNAYTLLREEGQMAETNGLLLVGRRQSIYAIDAASGNELWTVPIPGPYMPQSTSGLGLDGNTLLLYGNGQVQAIDLANHNLIWTRTLPASIHALKVATSGKQIYVTLDNSDAPGQRLMALDSRTGVTLWSFQTAGQAIFTGAAIIEEQGILLATLCAPETGAQSCAQENLYALNAATGAVNWQISAADISNISISPDGSMLLLQKAGGIL